MEERCNSFASFTNLGIPTKMLGHIHNHGTQKDGLMKKGLQRTIFGFLLHLLFYDYNGLVYDYN
jgi:hypothetical protein